MTWQSYRSIAVSAFVLLVAWTASAVAAGDAAATAGSTVGMARVVRTVQVVTEKILYVTNRKRTGSKLLPEQFAGERDAELRRGAGRRADLSHG